MAQPTGYSQEATVAAITSFYSFIEGMHADGAANLQLPPPTGWPQITHELFAPTGKTNTVIELQRHIPYFVTGKAGELPCIMDLTRPINYIDSQLLEALAAKSKKARRNRHIVYDRGPNMPPHIITLAGGGPRDGYEVLVDTDRGVVIWWKTDGHFPEGIFPEGAEWGDAECYDEEADFNGPDAWKAMPTFRVETFFEFCKEQFRIMNWMPVLEDMGEVCQLVGHQMATEEEAKRMQILKDAGWPGDGEGGGWDKETATRETEIWRGLLDKKRAEIAKMRRDLSLRLSSHEN